MNGFFITCMMSVNNAVLPYGLKSGKKEVVSINNSNRSCVVLHSFMSPPRCILQWKLDRAHRALYSVLNILLLSV